MAKGQITLVDLYDGEDGHSLTDVIKEFYLSDSDTVMTGGAWSEVQPEWSPGKYLWIRERLTWQNPTDTTYTTPQVSSEWEAITQVKRGERNLALNSNVPIDVTSTTSAVYTLTTPIRPSMTYTAVYKGTFTNMASGAYIGLYLNKDIYDQGRPTRVGDNIYAITFTTPSSFMDNTHLELVSLINTPKSTAVSTHIDWFKIVEGESTSYDWSQAPEDIRKTVTDIEFKVDELDNTWSSKISELGLDGSRLSQIEQNISGLSMTVAEKGRLPAPVEVNTVSSRPGNYVLSLPNFDLKKKYDMTIKAQSAGATYNVEFAISILGGQYEYSDSVTSPFCSQGETCLVNIQPIIDYFRRAVDPYAGMPSDYIVNITATVTHTNGTDTTVDSNPVFTIYERADNSERLAQLGIEIDKIQGDIYDSSGRFAQFTMEIDKIQGDLYDSDGRFAQLGMEIDKIQGEVYDSMGRSRITQTASQVVSIVTDGIDVPIDYNNLPGTTSKRVSVSGGYEHQLDVPSADVPLGERLTVTVTNTSSYSRTINELYLRFLSKHNNSWYRRTDGRPPVTVAAGKTYEYSWTIPSPYHPLGITVHVVSPSSSGLSISLTGTTSSQNTYNKMTRISQTASEIAVQGLVSFSDLTDTSQTIIDGGVIKSGTISANKIKTGTLSASSNSYTFWNLNTGYFANGTSATNQVRIRDGVLTSVGSTHETIIEQGTITVQKKGTLDVSQKLELAYNMPRISPYAPTSSWGMTMDGTRTGYSPPLPSYWSPDIYDRRFKLATYMLRVGVSSFTGWSDTFNVNIYNPTEKLDITNVLYAHAVCTSHKELILHIRGFNTTGGAFRGLQLQATLARPVSSWSSRDVAVSVLVIGTH